MGDKMSLCHPLNINIMYTDTKVKNNTTKPQIDKRLDDSIRNIISSIPDIKSSKYTYETKNGNLKIKVDRKKEDDLPIPDKLGYLTMGCSLIGILTFLITHVFYLTPLIMLFLIVLLYIPFSYIPSKMVRLFLQKILIPFMIITCIITGSTAWSRMNNMYEANANIRKEQIEKVHKNIPEWVYSIKK